MPLTYYIDGYNVIHQSRSIRPLLKADFETARDALVERVARFCSVTGERAQIVFDGRGRRAEPALPFHRAPGLEVVYSPGHQTADALIERSVYNTVDRRHLVVVSGDSGIRNLCRGLGALVMSPASFLATVRETVGNSRASLERDHRANPRLRVEDRLSAENLRQLRRLKDRLERGGPD